MAKINSFIDVIIFYLIAAALAMLVGICFAQVMARYIFQASFTWAEEVSIIIMLWATWGAACLGVKQTVHLRVQILEERLSARTNIVIRLALNCLAILFLIVVLLTSKTLLDAMAYMTLGSLPRVPTTVMYASVPIGCVFMIYYLLRGMASDLKSLLALG